MVEKEYVFKLSTDDAQANVDELNKSLELQEQLINDIEKEVRDYENQINKTSKKDLAQRKDLNDKIKQTKERLKDEKVALKSVNKDRKEANNTLKESTANAKDYSGVLGIIDQKTGGAISGFTNLTKSVGGATKGFNLMRIAIIGTGIGALLIAITSLSAAFTSSEEGQNKFAKIMGVIGSVTGNLVTLMADLGEKIIWVFEEPKQAIKDFANLIKENIVNRFNGLLELIPELGKAVNLLFSGDFSEAGKVAANAVGKVALGIENVVDKTNDAINSTKEFIDELIREGEIAGAIADKRAKADKLERDLIIERSKANRDRADLLNKAVDKENFKLQERIGFLQEAGQIEEDITNKELAAAQLRLEAKVAENALANSTKEDLNEEAQLRANLIDLETAKLTKAKEVTSQITALNAEARATELAAKGEQDLKDDEADADEILKAQELKALETQIRDAEAVTADERRALELQKTIEHYDKLIAAAKVAGLEIAGLEKAKGVAVSNFAEDSAEQEVTWAEMSMNEKLNLAKQGFNNLATILGEETAAGKAAAIASATISTYQSAVSSYNSLSGIPVVGPILGGLAAGAAVASGFAQVKAITGTKLPTLGGKTPPAVSSGGASAPPLPRVPSFNVVGESGTNQLAEAIGEQEQKPVQAFVVASDVSSAQELDRNIIEGASIG